MATAAQIIANQANAQLSTGPRTDSGKAASAANSRRHGLTARGFIILPGQEEAFDGLEEAFRIRLIPSGVIQEALFIRILECAWNLNRCRLAQAALYSTAACAELDPLLDDQNEAKYARIEKYARQNESSMLRVMKELGRLQTEDQYRHEAHPLTEEVRDDPEQLDQTPHALSDLCQFQKIEQAMKGKPVVRAAASRRSPRREAEAAFMDMLEKLTAPPILQNEANPIPFADAA